jgi:hypothetical protein
MCDLSTLSTCGSFAPGARPAEPQPAHRSGDALAVCPATPTVGLRLRADIRLGAPRLGRVPRLSLYNAPMRRARRHGI